MERQFKHIKQLLQQNELVQVFTELKPIIERSDCLICKHIYREQLESYKFLLKYFINQVDDPKRDKIINSIILKIYEILDYLNWEQKRKKIILQDLFIGWLEIVQDEKLQISKLINDEIHNNVNELRTLFYTIAFTTKFSDDDIKQLSDYILSDDLPLTENIQFPKHIVSQLLVSAITISLIEFLDFNKFILLTHIYKAQIDDIWERAIVGIVLSIYMHNDRMIYSDNIKKILVDLQNELPEFKEHIRATVLQLVATEETENILKEFKEEIYPEVQKYSDSVFEKFDIEDIEKLIDEEHPDWENIIDEELEKNTSKHNSIDEKMAFLEKMANFSMKQLEGSDVFLTAFENLKDFSFFSEPMNWFMPYYPGHPELKNTHLANMKGDILNKISGIFYMCNSDKYSFAFHIDTMPFFQKQFVASLLRSEALEMEQINQNQAITNPSLNYINVITQYIQDLYRFYNISEFSQNFVNVFKLDTDIYNAKIMELLDNYPDILEDAADMFFSRKLYPQAIYSYEKLINKYAKNTLFNYEHLAYAYQKMKNFKKALENYQYAEFLDVEKQWIYKKIAYNAYRVGDYNKAIEYYKKTEELEPNDLHIKIFLGKSYLMLKKYPEALKYFFDIEYHNPKNIKVLRLIAWTYFVSKNIDKALIYNEKVLQLMPIGYDFMNYANVLWAMGDRKKAAENYIKAMKKYEDRKLFFDDLTEDLKILKQYNIDEKEQRLMLEYLRFNA